MKIYKTDRYVLESARSRLEVVKGYHAELEAQLKEKDPDYPSICGGFHGSLECAILAMEWFLEMLEEVDENEHV